VAEPMRALFTVPWTERLGGGEMMLWTFLRNVDRSRLEPAVVFLEPGPFQEEVAALGFRTYSVPIGRLRDPRGVGRAVRTLTSVIRADDPDVIVNWVAKAQIYGGIAALAARRSRNVVWWQHGVPSGHWMDRLATALPARAVGCSSGVAARAQARTWPHRPTFVVHPGIDTDASRPIDRDSLGIPEGRLVAGIVGRLQPWKGQHRFLEALAQLRDEGHDVHGLVVGGDAFGLSPEYTRELDELVERLRLGDRVTMTGHVRDARPYMAAMDVLVSASEGEPFGIVLIEGMAEGVPVVAVSDAGPAEIVETGASGVLVPAPESRLIADAVSALVRDPRLRRRLSLGARTRAVEHFGAPAMAARLESILRPLARA
jgi:glycosyltransferase involved in cell wall biosynthesis